MFQKTQMVKYSTFVEGFFNCKCSVYKYEKVAEGSFTKTKLVPVYENLICRRGYSTNGNINYTKTAEVSFDNVDIKQLVKLFLPKDIKIEAGSYVVVDYGGCKEYYEFSGICLKYDTHTEVLLKGVERWA